MAEKKTATKATNTTVKPIILRDDRENVYVLEYNRDSIKFAEARGFKTQALEDGISISNMEDLFYYAFRMHHPNVSKATTDHILYDELGGFPEGMLERLAELYMVPFTTLIQDGDKAKNSTMTVEF